MLRKSELEQMKNVDIQTVDKASLVDLNDVVIDTSQPVEQRIKSFIAQMKNPYVFRIGDVAVKVNYADSGPSFNEIFESIINFYRE